MYLMLCLNAKIVIVESHNNRLWTLLVWKEKYLSFDKEISVIISIHCLARFHQFLFILTENYTMHVSHSRQYPQLLYVYTWT